MKRRDFLKSSLAVAAGMSLGIPELFAADGQYKAVVNNIHIPVGMIYDADNTLYIAEWGASRVCKYDGQYNRTLVTDAVGQPSGLAMDNSGNLYINSYDRGIIYILDPGGKLRQLASGFNVPAGSLLIGNDLIVANREAGEVVKVSLRNGAKEAISRGHKQPLGLVRFGDGTLLVSCWSGGIDRISPDGKVDILSTAMNSPSPGMIADGSNAVIAADYGGTALWRIGLDGSASIIADGFRTPVGLTRMPDGRLLVGDWGYRAAFIVDYK